MTDAMLKEAREKTRILHIPTVLGADVPAYNVPGVSGEVKFTPEALAGIFLGQITKWNDRTITSANPGVNFPDRESSSSTAPMAAAGPSFGPIICRKSARNGKVR